MRYGLLALSLAMLTSGAVAAQSALAISASASVAVQGEAQAKAEHGGSYGSIPFTAARTEGLRFAAR